MTDQQHPMIPPNILLNNWESDWFAERQNVDYLLTEAYQAGADAELEACCEWLKSEGHEYEHEALFAARRPKPPSLREEALAKTTALLDDPGRALLIEVREVLELNRCALEALSDDLR